MNIFIKPIQGIKLMSIKIGHHVIQYMALHAHCIEEIGGIPHLQGADFVNTAVPLKGDPEGHGTHVAGRKCNRAGSSLMYLFKILM